MKGVNDLTLCESAMMEALQFWLNAQFIKAAPKVTGISGHQDRPRVARARGPDDPGAWDEGVLHHSTPQDPLRHN